MMEALKTLSVTAFIAIALLLASCGGDNGKSISKREYIARSNAICEKTGKQAGEQYGRIVGTGRPTQEKVPRFQRFLSEAVVPNLRRNVEERGKVPAPEGDEEEVKAIISAGRNAVAGFSRIAADRPGAEALWRGEAADPATEFDELSKGYGIDKCAGEE